MGVALAVFVLLRLYQGNVFGLGKTMSYAEYEAVDASTSAAAIRNALGKPDTSSAPVIETGDLQIETWFYMESVRRGDGTRCDVTFRIELHDEHGRVTDKALGGCH